MRRICSDMERITRLRCRMGERKNKQWLALTLWLVVGFHAQPASPGNTPIPALDGAYGVHTLTSAWLLLEQEAHNTRIRVYRMTTGELPCVYDPQSTCQFERLAIGLATTGEHPVRKVYLTPLAIGWNFPDIVRRTDATRPDDFIEITVKEVSERQDEMGWVAHKDRFKERTLFVNLHEAYLQ